MPRRKAKISAKGKASHTALSPATRPRIHAAGRMSTSCRSTDTSRLSTPLPRAWHTEEVTMPKAAKIKLRLMTRRAGTPISSI